MQRDTTRILKKINSHTELGQPVNYHLELVIDPVNSNSVMCIHTTNRHNKITSKTLFLITE